MSIYDCGLDKQVQERLAQNLASLVQHKKKRSERMNQFILWSARTLSEGIVYTWKTAAGLRTFTNLDYTLSHFQ